MTKTICTECAFRGEPRDAFKHFYETRHVMTYKGIVQKFDTAVREQDAIRDCYESRRKAEEKSSAA